jgi:hypothetical protein
MTGDGRPTTDDGRPRLVADSIMNTHRIELSMLQNNWRLGRSTRTFYRANRLGWIVILCALFVLAACTGAQEQAPSPTAMTEESAGAAGEEAGSTATTEPVALPTLTPIPTAVPGVLYVNAGEDLGPISPLIFGTNYGPWVSLRPETLPLAEQAGIAVIRWPGGAWGDQNDVQLTQVDQFVTLSRRLGAEPYIHVRFLKSTPERAAALVRYANVDRGYKIRYWSIGNEPSLFESAGDGWSAEEFSQEWRHFAEAMKAEDPSIRLVGPETHQFTGTADVDPRDSAGRDWLRTFLEANGDLVDVVSVHRYPFPNTAERRSAPPRELLANSESWNDIVRRLRATVRETTGRDLPVAITEFNSHWTNASGGETTPDSFLSSLWLADVLGRLVQERVEMANQFLLVSGPENGFGILGRYEARPAYAVYRLYSEFGDQLVYSSVDQPGISLYAARREDGALTLVAINRNEEEAAIPLRLEGFTPGGDAEVWRFDPEHRADPLDPLPLADGAEVTLPPLSMTLYVLRED